MDRTGDVDMKLLQKMNKMTALTLAIGMMLYVYPAGSLSAASANTADTKASSEANLPIIRIVPSAYQAKVGDTIEVAIWLQGFTGDYRNIQGYEVHLDFDSSILVPSQDSKNLTPSIFKKTSNPMSLVNKINPSGTVQISEAVTSSDAKLFTGYGKVGTVSFQAVKAGTVTLKQSKSIIIQPDNPGINITHKISEPTITIRESGTIVDKVNEKIQTIGEAAVKKVKQPASSEILAAFKDKGSITKLTWAQDAIGKLALSEVLQGTSEGNFEPLRNMTRAEFAKSAIIALGLDMVQQQSPSFSDISSSDWYYDYVETAGKNGLMQGSKNNQGQLNFKPNAPITRAELASILSRVLKNSGKGATVDHTNPFTDIKAHWAKEDIIYLYGNKLIQGKSAVKFGPGDSASRAEVSVMLERIQQAVN